MQRSARERKGTGALRQRTLDTAVVSQPQAIDLHTRATVVALNRLNLVRANKGVDWLSN